MVERLYTMAHRRQQGTPEHSRMLKGMFLGETDRTKPNKNILADKRLREMMAGRDYDTYVKLPKGKNLTEGRIRTLRT